MEAKTGRTKSQSRSRSRGLVSACWRLRSKVGVALGVAVVTQLALVAGSPASSAAAQPTLPTLPTAYVTNSQLNSLSIYKGAHLAGTVPNVGSGPTGIAINSTGTTAYVADFGFFDTPSYTVTPVDLASGQALTPIKVGTGPLAIALTPNDRFAVVTLQGTASHPGHEAREINLRTGAVSPRVPVGTNPQSVAISPDGTRAYVAALASAEVTPVALAVWPPRALPPIQLPGTSPNGIAIAPDGRTAYVLDSTNATVIPISLPSGKVGQPLDLVCHAQGDPGCTPHAIVISPDGRTAYVAAAGSDDMMLLNLNPLSVAGVVQVAGYPDAIGLSGRWLYVANAASNTMSIFKRLETPRTVAGVTYPYGVAVVPGSAAGNTPPVSAPLPVSAVHGAPEASVRTHPTPFYGAG
jgi:DNA-binding beta-propeller fold protein YncE